MNIDGMIDNFLAVANAEVGQKGRRQKITLYAEGVKAKLRQADFALRELTRLNGVIDANISSTAAGDEFKTSEKVQFYCDAFWTFLYSSLDVLAQVANQAIRLDLEEKNVSFRRVKKKLGEPSYKSLPVSCHFAECTNSTAFKNLEKYRNCSTHRRQIYIEEKITQVRGTSGYISSTRPRIPAVERLICDDALTLNPKVLQERRIPEYMERAQARLLQYVDKIVQNMPISG